MAGEMSAGYALQRGRHCLRTGTGLMERQIANTPEHLIYFRYLSRSSSKPNKIALQAQLGSKQRRLAAGSPAAGAALERRGLPGAAESKWLSSGGLAKGAWPLLRTA